MRVSFLHDCAGDSDENLIDSASQAEEKAIRFFSRFFHTLLTNLHDKCIIHFDNDVCHQGKQICQTEVLYGTAKSLEGVPGNAERQSAGNGALVRRITADNQPDYSPSVTLALTIAKVCGASVEEIFYLQEGTEHEE